MNSNWTETFESLRQIAEKAALDDAFDMAAWREIYDCVGAAYYVVDYLSPITSNAVDEAIGALRAAISSTKKCLQRLESKNPELCTKIMPGQPLNIVQWTRVACGLSESLLTHLEKIKTQHGDSPSLNQVPRLSIVEPSPAAN
jgi:hypothetical protein